MAKIELRLVEAESALELKNTLNQLAFAGKTCDLECLNSFYVAGFPLSEPPKDHTAPDSSQNAQIGSRKKQVNLGETPYHHWSSLILVAPRVPSSTPNSGASHDK